MFTKIVTVAAAHLRMQSFLFKNRETILRRLSRQGCLIIKEKSSLVPTQDILYLGAGEVLRRHSIDMPTQEIKVKFRNAVVALLEKTWPNETNTTSSVVLVENGMQRPRTDHSKVRSFKRESELVVTGS